MSSEPLLGRQVGHPIPADAIDLIDCPSNVTEVTFTTNELSATCGKTHQPDIYTAVITYRPEGKALESKALKHYLWGFRDAEIFAEDLAAAIAHDLTKRLRRDNGSPTVSVKLVQQVRGGLVLTVNAVGGH